MNREEQNVILAAMSLAVFNPPPEDEGTPRGDAHRHLIQTVKELRKAQRKSAKKGRGR